MNEGFLSTKGVFFGHSAAAPQQLTEDLNLQKGQLLPLLGRNGAGKSSFLKTLSRQIPILAGQISLQKQPIGSYSSQAYAKLLSLVSTERVAADFLSGWELVALGRYPHLRFWAKPDEAEIRFLRAIFERLGIDYLQQKPINECSDGERQLLMLARALAQDTDLLLLDEISAHLDFINRRRLFELLASLAKEQNKLIFIATHELDLAAQYSEQALIFDNKTAKLGRADYFDQ